MPLLLLFFELWLAEPAQAVQARSEQRPPLDMTQILGEGDEIFHDMDLGPSGALWLAGDRGLARYYRNHLDRFVVLRGAAFRPRQIYPGPRCLLVAATTGLFFVDELRSAVDGNFQGEWLLREPPIAVIPNRLDLATLWHVWTYRQGELTYLAIRLNADGTPFVSSGEPVQGSLIPKDFFPAEDRTRVLVRARNGNWYRGLPMGPYKPLETPPESWGAARRKGCGAYEGPLETRPRHSVDGPVLFGRGRTPFATRRLVLTANDLFGFGEQGQTLYQIPLPINPAGNDLPLEGEDIRFICETLDRRLWLLTRDHRLLVLPTARDAAIRFPLNDTGQVPELLTEPVPDVFLLKDRAGVYLQREQRAENGEIIDRIDLSWGFSPILPEAVFKDRATLWMQTSNRGLIPLGVDQFRKGLENRTINLAGEAVVESRGAAVWDIFEGQALLWREDHLELLDVGVAGETQLSWQQPLAPGTLLQVVAGPEPGSLIAVSSDHRLWYLPPGDRFRRLDQVASEAVPRLLKGPGNRIFLDDGKQLRFFDSRTQQFVTHLRFPGEGRLDHTPIDGIINTGGAFLIACRGCPDGPLLSVDSMGNKRTINLATDSPQRGRPILLTQFSGAQTMAWMDGVGFVLNSEGRAIQKNAQAYPYRVVTQTPSGEIWYSLDEPGPSRLYNERGRDLTPIVLPHTAKFLVSGTGGNLAHERLWVAGSDWLLAFSTEQGDPLEDLGDLITKAGAPLLGEVKGLLWDGSALWVLTATELYRFFYVNDRPVFSRVQLPDRLQEPRPSRFFMALSPQGIPYIALSWADLGTTIWTKPDGSFDFTVVEALSFSIQGFTFDQGGLVVVDDRGGLRTRQDSGWMRFALIDTGAERSTLVSEAGVLIHAGDEGSYSFFHHGDSANDVTLPASLPPFRQGVSLGDTFVLAHRDGSVSRLLPENGNLRLEQEEVFCRGLARTSDDRILFADNGEIRLLRDRGVIKPLPDELYGEGELQLRIIGLDLWMWGSGEKVWQTRWDLPEAGWQSFNISDNPGGLVLGLFAGMNEGEVFLFTEKGLFQRKVQGNTWRGINDDVFLKMATVSHAILLSSDLLLWVDDRLEIYRTRLVNHAGTSDQNYQLPQRLTGNLQGLERLADGRIAIGSERELLILPSNFAQDATTADKATIFKLPPQVKLKRWHVTGDDVFLLTTDAVAAQAAPWQLFHARFDQPEPDPVRSLLLGPDDQPFFFSRDSALGWRNTQGIWYADLNYHLPSTLNYGAEQNFGWTSIYFTHKKGQQTLDTPVSFRFNRLDHQAFSRRWLGPIDWGFSSGVDRVLIAQSQRNNQRHDRELYLLPGLSRRQIFLPPGLLFFFLLAILGVSFWVRIRRLRRLRRLRRENPFIDGGVITDPKRFFGREAMIRAIRDQIPHNSFFLLGDYRTGKTSLQFRLRHLWLHEVQDKDYHYIPVFCSMEALKDDGERFFYTLGQALTKTIRDEHGISEDLLTQLIFRKGEIQYEGIDFEEDFEDIISWFKQEQAQRTPLVIFQLDEIAYLEAVPEHGLMHFRSLSITNKNLSAILSGPVIPRQERVNVSPWWNAFRQLRISPLTLDETREMIRDTTKNLVTFDDALIKEIWEGTSGHPLETQRICKNCLNHFYESGRKSTTLTVELCRGLVKSPSN